MKRYSLNPNAVWAAGWVVLLLGSLALDLGLLVYYFPSVKTLLP